MSKSNSLNDSGTAKIKEVFFCLRIAITQKNLATEKNKKQNEMEKMKENNRVYNLFTRNHIKILFFVRIISTILL